MQNGQRRQQKRFNKAENILLGALFAKFLVQDPETKLYDYADGWDDARMLGQTSGHVTDIKTLTATRHLAGYILNSERRHINLSNGQRRSHANGSAKVAKLVEDHNRLRQAHNSLVVRVLALEEAHTAKGGP